MSNNIKIAPYKEIWEVIYNQSKTTLYCKCGALASYIGKINYQNKNYDVFQARLCLCPAKHNPIPFLDKSYSHFKFNDDSWHGRKYSDAPNISHLCMLQVAIPTDPVYKLVEVKIGKNSYAMTVPMTETEKVQYYNKLSLKGKA